MDYDLRIEGFSMDEDLEEQLLLRCRRVVLSVGSRHPVRVNIRQVDGRVQGRVDVVLPGRRVSAVVWRSDPVKALEGVANAVIDAVEKVMPLSCERGGSATLEEAFSTLQ